MAYVYPIPVADLADLLPIESATWDIKRNDELSGSGDGRVWQAELADPLWRGDINLAASRHDQIKQIAARIRKLYGAQNSFYLFDPLSPYPQADKTGSILGNATVQVKAVSVNRTGMQLKGLPAGYILTIGDKMQVTYSSNPVRNFFVEVSETIVADGSGETATFEVFPNVAIGVLANDAVNLKKPACKVFIMPDSFNPGAGRGKFTYEASLKVMERKR